MAVDIIPATLNDKPILRNLMELYLYDFSEYENSDVDEHGRYGYEWLDHYWTEPERHPFMIRVEGKLAGFVLVRDLDPTAVPVTHSIAEFFVLKKYRRHGIGREAAFAIFNRFPGRWNVCQEEANLPAQTFWRKVIAEYTQGNYTEEHLHSEEWRGPCQTFQSNIPVT